MPRVIVFGNATVDLTLCLPRFPVTGETVLARSLSRSPGGKGLNQAVAAARAGADVELIAPIGRDVDGAFLAAYLRAEGIMSAAILAPGTTDVSMIWVDYVGANMIASSADAARSIKSDAVNTLLASLGRDDILIMQGNLRADTTLAAAQQARARGARILFNPAPIAEDLAGLLRFTDLLIANEIEAETLTGCGPEAAIAPLHRLGAETVIVSLGARGALYSDGHTTLSVAAPPVEALDTSGAGDVLVGTIGAMLARSLDGPAALEIAIRAASLSVTRAGTTPSFPTAAEMRALIAAPQQRMPRGS